MVNFQALLFRVGKKFSTFISMFKASPGFALGVLQIKIERLLGITLFWIDPLRFFTRMIEVLNTKKLPQNFVLIGNYFIDPSEMTKDSIVLSIGIGDDVTFDKGLIEFCNPRIYLVDPTPFSASFVESQGFPSKVSFHPVAISNSDGEIELFSDSLETEITSIRSFSIKDLGLSKSKIKVTSMKISSFLEKEKISRIEVLKMDTEGAALDALLTYLNIENCPRQIVCEFERPTGWKDFRIFLGKIRRLFELLAKLNYQVYRTRNSDLGFQIEILAVLSKIT